MRFLLNAYTDAATYALFDPKALPAAEFRPKEYYIDTLLRVAANGQAVAYMATGDSSHFMLLLVDEPVEDRFRESNEHVVTQGYLWVPSGRLVYVGWEQVNIDSDYDPDTFSTDSSDPEEPGECQVPAGHYAVEVYEMDWGEQMEETVEKMTSPEDVRYSNRYDGFFGCGCLATLAGVLILLYSFFSQDLPTLTFLAYIAGFLIVYWAIMFYFGRSPKLDRVLNAKMGIERDFPELVIQLTTIPERPAQFNPPITYIHEDKDK